MQLQLGQSLAAARHTDAELPEIDGGNEPKARRVWIKIDSKPHIAGVPLRSQIIVEGKVALSRSPGALAGGLEVEAVCSDLGDIGRLQQDSMLLTVVSAVAADPTFVIDACRSAKC